MQFIKADDFSEIANDFDTLVQEMVWCSATTVDEKGRPRARVLHPIWEGATGWIGTSPLSTKAKQIAQNPYMSFAYIKNPFKPVYIDCKVAWVDDMAEKQRIWDLFQTLPEPYGYDPTPFFGSVEAEAFGLLKLNPWRIELYELGVQSRIWQAEN